VNKKRFTFTKVLTSIALFGGCFVPALMDLGNTHLLKDFRGYYSLSGNSLSLSKIKRRFSCGY